ncbi:hypothetical protein BCD06_004782 [Escherichia coli]|nr:hypothetical protein [Escherichia coli]EEV7035774.1 hypothetical protein [Escherichia coli]EFG3747988.1 hypothetical protein [Escherichia coli]EFJ4045087.1 hypothetical protein [Escherichia coli]EGA0336282.1 hypothetical protein [Escherichia coli]
MDKTTVLNDINCEVFLSGQLMCFLQAAGNQQLQLLPKIRETGFGEQWNSKRR